LAWLRRTELNSCEPFGMTGAKPTMLLAGGGYADIPLILAAKRLGFHVVSSGNRPSELGHAYSDEFRSADFSNPEQIAALAKEIGATAICASCNDFSALSAAYAAEKLGLPGHDRYEISQILHHKDRYREFAQANGIPSPVAHGFSNLESARSYLRSAGLPLIVKPVDLTGGKGVSTVRSLTEGAEALERAFEISRAKRVVLEDFLEGSRHGFSAVLRDGKVVFYFSDNEHYFQNQYMVSAASTPSTVSEVIEADLVVQSEKIAGLLGIRAGIFHVQYILTNRGPVIIEICRRAPGDLYIRLVEIATGVPYPEVIVRAAAGMSIDSFAHAKPKGFFSRHCIMSSTAGVVDHIEFREGIEEQIVERHIWAESGWSIDSPLVAKCGIVFLRFGSQAEMLEKTERMQDIIRVVLRRN
jgi:biotin carboxylase